MRHFACTACGQCCDRGPEMELGEAAGLAGTFILSMIVKVHSLPIDDRSSGATRWWQQHGSRIPLRAALEEQRRHASLFASRRRSDRRGDRQIFLTISAIVEEDKRGHCPALSGDRCGIYDMRPLTCRTVPLHYSRPPSTLRDYLDRFTATPGYRCDVSPTAPAVLDGNAVLDPAVRRHREEAVELARRDRPWKDAILRAMDDPAAAGAARLPTYDDVLANSSNGYATLLPMIVAWRVAWAQGLLSRGAFLALCRSQAVLIDAEIGRRMGDIGSGGLREMRSLYAAELAQLG